MVTKTFTGINQLKLRVASLLLLSLALAMNGFANPIDEQQALKLAQNFFEKYQTNAFRNSHNKANKLVLSAVALRNPQAKLNLATATSSQLRQATVTNQACYYYIFNKPQQGGYVIIAGDDIFAPVLSYSLSGQFDLASAPKHVKSFFEKVNIALENALTHGTPENLAAMRPIPTAILSDKLPNEVPVLLDIHWNQDEPWNLQCPIIKGSYGQKIHAAVGCVATALSQIMRYHEWPIKPEGVFEYDEPEVDSNGQPTSKIVRHHKVDYSSQVYNYALMPKTVRYNVSDEEAKELSKLCYHVGVGVQMMYGESSGATSVCVMRALKENFRYNKGMRLHLREVFDPIRWEVGIRTDLANKRLVYYTGVGPGGGHAFVLDGYNNEGLYHVNWGWQGTSDGYFNLNILDPQNLGIGGGAGGGFSLEQECITGLYPDRDGTTKHVIPELFTGRFEGSFNASDHSFTTSKVWLYASENYKEPIRFSIGIQALGGEAEPIKVSNEAIQTITIRPINIFTLFVDFKNKKITDWGSLNDGVYKIIPVFQANNDNNNPEWQIIRGYTNSKYNSYILLEVSNNGKTWKDITKNDLPKYAAISLKTSKVKGEKFSFQSDFFGKLTTEGLSGNYESGILNTANLTNSDVLISGHFNTFSATGQGIEAINLNNTKNVTSLRLDNNNISQIELSRAVNLKSLNVAHNKLEKLSVSNNPKLTLIDISGNPIKGEAVTNLVRSLPLRKKANVGYLVLAHHGEKPIEMRSSVKTSALNKNWKIAVRNEKGDIMVDGKVVLATTPATIVPNIAVYPNPASNMLHIEGLTIGNEIRLYNMQGELLFETIANAQELTLNVAQFAKGNYILTVGDYRTMIVIE